MLLTAKYSPGVLCPLFLETVYHKTQGFWR